VFDVEVGSYQGLLSAVHTTAKTVAAAAKGLEPANAEVLEMIRNLANNQVRTIVIRLLGRYSILIPNDSSWSQMGGRIHISVNVGNA
jgi:hypothetical protein